MKKIALIILCFIIQSVSSQITCQIKNITVNNVPISNNGQINFGNNSSVVVRFTTQFTKPNDVTVGNVSHVIGTYTNSGFVPLITPEFLTLGINNTGFTGNWEKTLYASDYGYTGGNYLVSIVQQTSGQTLKWESNQVIINRTPIFTISPSSLNIICGNTSSQTFTVNNNGIPSGTTVSYNWSTGTGWSGTLNNTNTITLTPTSGTILPSNISVIPVFNGVNLPAITCSVSRTIFSSLATISGATNICIGTSTYTISNILNGQSVIWNLSNPNIATLSNQTNSQVEVTFNGNGAQTLTATISNTCGQTVTKSFVINTGVTTFTSLAYISNPTNLCLGSNTFTISGVLSDENVTWSLSNPNIASLSDSSNSQTIVTSTGIGLQTLTALITNPCGQSVAKTKTFWVGSPGTATLTTSSGIPYDQFNLPLGSTSGNPYWIFGPSISSATVTSYKIINNGLTFYKSATNGNVTITAQELGMAPGQTLSIKVTPVNNCGSIPKDLIFTLYRPTLCQSGIGVGCNLARMSNSDSSIYTIYPNPSKDIVYIDLKNPTILSEKSITILGELFDTNGISKSKVAIINNKATFSVSGLKKGIYVLRIYINDKIESHQIAVE